MSGTTIWRIADGKIVEHWSEMNVLCVMQQIGRPITGQFSAHRDPDLEGLEHHQKYQSSESEHADPDRCERSRVVEALRKNIVRLLGGVPGHVVRAGDEAHRGKDRDEDDDRYP